MNTILILNGLILISLWVTGFVALQTNQLPISISIALVILLQLWLFFELVQMSKRDRERVK